MGLIECCDNVGAYVECCTKPVLGVWRLHDSRLSEIYCINCSASIISIRDTTWASQAALMLKVVPFTNRS